jgi:hypothetical protein
MRTALLLIGFNRLDLFDQTLSSLEANDAAHNHDLHVYLDGGPNALQNELVARIEESSFKNITVVKRQENWGIGRHLIDARRRLFDELDYDRVMLFEDDMVLATHYVETLSNMLDWASEYTDVGTVMAFNINPDPMDAQSNQLSDVIATNRHFWGYGMTKDVWNDIKSILYEFEDRFLKDVPYGKRAHRSIRRKFIRRIMKQNRMNRSGKALVPDHLLTPPFSQRPGRCPTSQDAITALALWHQGYARITTRVSRALYVGKSGFSFSPEVFENMGFNEQNVPDFISLSSAPVMFRLVHKGLDGRPLKPTPYE